ncbi:hypothetical protein GRAN_0830 [Granulicella sibirica]|uniref:Uncharacterized protein n=1 Tax=Granulicella sibirica TaxID=2479048 RepID=A0A4Q0T4M3_9BACT|nr:hypothetical protein GRAN_0830 [Granulicella sibirica]
MERRLHRRSVLRLGAGLDQPRPRSVDAPAKAKRKLTTATTSLESCAPPAALASLSIRASCSSCLMARLQPCHQKTSGKGASAPEAPILSTIRHSTSRSSHYKPNHLNHLQK